MVDKAVIVLHKCLTDSRKKVLDFCSEFLEDREPEVSIEHDEIEFNLLATQVTVVLELNRVKMNLCTTKCNRMDGKMLNSQSRIKIVHACVVCVIYSPVASG